MNYNLIFLDLETTGLDTSQCEIIECAFTSWPSISYISNSLFKPTSPIPPEVSGVTNIDNIDVINCQIFPISDMSRFLIEMAKDPSNIIVTHNTDFDLAVLARYGIVFKSSICTYKLSWKLYPNLANHKLGTLRAMYNIPADGSAHRADYDVQVLIQVFENMVSVWDLMPVEKMVAASEKAKLDFLNTWPFGKYKGQWIILPDHLDYIRWNLNSNKSINEDFKNHLRSLLNQDPAKQLTPLTYQDHIDKAD